MNKKEAQEIIDIANGFDGQISRVEYGQEMKARGWLEGHVVGVKEERDKIKIMIETLDGETYKETGCWCPGKGKTDVRHDLCRVIQEALQQYLDKEGGEGSLTVVENNKL